MSKSTKTPRRVKIVATLGPASASLEGVCALAEAGANVFRLNSAHTQPESLAPLVALVRKAEIQFGRPLAVFCDLAGPKLRVAKSFPSTAVVVGTRLTIGHAQDGAKIPVEGVDLAKECPIGTRIFIHDGKVALKVVDVTSGVVLTEVVRGGEVMGGWGVNLPDVETSLPSLTDHDLRSLHAALAAGVDAVSLSFVRRAQDITDLRSHMKSFKLVVPIIAKLEKAQAIASLSVASILRVTDMIMIARGDLGVETSPEMVPILQKQILRAARSCGIPTITATEMLESMIHEPRPTRAEAADVANAVFDGTDAVMLSGETAVGDHPALVIEMCDRIVRQAEQHSEYRVAWANLEHPDSAENHVAHAVAEAAAAAATQLDAAAVVCFTNTGRTARLVARHRPAEPILALTANADVARALALVWGVDARVCEDHPSDHEGVVELAEREALRHGVARSGDLIVVTHGAPIGLPITNVMRVHRVGS